MNSGVIKFRSFGSNPQFLPKNQYCHIATFLHPAGHMLLGSVLFRLIYGHDGGQLTQNQ
jgi:hypothetical protein